MANDLKYSVLLEKVLEDLRDFLPYLVLVGGWVPFLYSRYLWKIHHEPIQTTDIDFGFKNVDYNGKETIATRVKKKNYEERHLKLGHMIPFVPVVQVGKNLKADVEFITSPETSERIKKRLIGDQIKINIIEDFDILMESPIFLSVNKNQVFVPDPAIFTFHKLFTFAARSEKEKRLKDLYYAYYVIFFSPTKDNLPNAIAQWIQKLRAGKMVQKNIEKYFADPDDQGPSWIEEASRGTSIQTLVDDIRKDAFERVRKLIT